jgi:transposase
MKPPLFVRELSAAERATLRRGLRSADAFTLRRSQVLLASAGGQRPSQIAAALGCATQTVRDAVRAWNARGADALAARSRAPKTTHPVWPRTRDDDLKGLLHQSPRTFGKPTSLWTLGLVAAVCHEKGWTPRALSLESVRRVLKRLGIGWKRAKHWLTSPDPEYAKKKSSGTG